MSVRLSADTQRRRAGRSGFTLIEMLVAVALAALITIMVVVAFTQGRAVWAETYMKSEAVHNAQAALDYIEAELQGAYLAGQNIFLGVPEDKPPNPPNDDLSVDNDDDDDLDEDLDVPNLTDPSAYHPFNPTDHDPVDFINTAGQERHGLEFLSSSRYAVDDTTGEAVGGVHVLYYVTRDSNTGRLLAGEPYEVGRLIRRSEVRDENPVSRWMGEENPGFPQTEEAATLVYGITQFQLRYYYDRAWFTGWDSTDPDGWDGIPGNADDVQTGRLPQVVEVTMRVLDVFAKLDSEGNRNPFVISRLIHLDQANP